MSDHVRSVRASMNKSGREKGPSTKSSAAMSLMASVDSASKTTKNKKGKKDSVGELFERGPLGDVVARP